MNKGAKDKKEIKKFGMIAFLFFGCLFSIGFWRQKELITYIFASLSCLGFLLILFPEPLKPIYFKTLHRHTDRVGDHHSFSPI